MMSKKTRNMYLTMIHMSPQGFHQIPYEHRTEELSFLAICHYPELIKDIKEQSLRMKNKIARKSPRLFKYLKIDDEEDYDIILRCVKAIGSNIKYVNSLPREDYYQDYKRAAIANNSGAIFLCCGVDDGNIVSVLDRSKNMRGCLLNNMFTRELIRGNPAIARAYYWDYHT